MVVAVGLKSEEQSFLLTCENMHTQSRTHTHTQSAQIMLTQSIRLSANACKACLHVLE